MNLITVALSHCCVQCYRKVLVDYFVISITHEKMTENGKVLSYRRDETIDEAARMLKRYQWLE